MSTYTSVDATLDTSTPPPLQSTWPEATISFFIFHFFHFLLRHNRLFTSSCPSLLINILFPRGRHLSPGIHLTRLAISCSFIPHPFTLDNDIQCTWSGEPLILLSPIRSSSITAQRIPWHHLPFLHKALDSVLMQAQLTRSLKAAILQVMTREVTCKHSFPLKNVHLQLFLVPYMNTR